MTCDQPAISVQTNTLAPTEKQSGRRAHVTKAQR